MTLTAILIFFLFLPGLLFALRFYNSDSIPFTSTSLTHRAIIVFMGALLAHGLGFIVLLFLGVVVNYELIFELMLGVVQATQLTSLHLLVYPVLFYGVFVSFIGYFAGLVSRIFIKKYELEQYPFFQIDNPWYYLFKGYNRDIGMADGVKVAATIEIAGKSYLYLGVLADFFLGADGNIDRLILTAASRRELSNDKAYDKENVSDRFYPIDGDCFVLKYNQIKNLNIEYFDS